MVRIIQEGKLPAERLYRIACRHCETLFEFKGSEARSHRASFAKEYLSIDCPLDGCKQAVYVAHDNYVRPIPIASDVQGEQ